MRNVFSTKFSKTLPVQKGFQVFVLSSYMTAWPPLLTGNFIWLNHVQELLHYELHSLGRHC